MTRFADIVLSLVGILVSLPLLAVFIFVWFLDTGSPIFRQCRVGRNLRPFTIFKLRTMRMDTHSVPTHLTNGAASDPLWALFAPG